jgi:hypothetical protein
VNPVLALPQTFVTEVLASIRIGKSEEVIVEPITQGVVVLRINRPDRLNALNLAPLIACATTSMHLRSMKPCV